MHESMTKQDAIEYLLYLKHDVQAKSPMDIALDTAIEVLKQNTIEPEQHGRWKCICEYEEFNEEMADYLCESCGYVISRLKNQKPKFCENCGRRMIGGADNDT